MRCEQCGAELPEDGQRFCNHCGAPVDHLTRPDDTESRDEDLVEPEVSSTPAVETRDEDLVEPEAPSEPVAEELDDDAAITITVLDVDDDGEPTSTMPAANPAATTDATASATTVTPAVDDAAFSPHLPAPVLYDAASDLADGDATLPFHLARPQIGVVVVLGGLTGVLGLLGLFPRVLTIRTTSTSPAFGTGDWLVADLGGNLPAALIVALVALLVGLIGAAYRQRWGFGLVGGAGLAIAGWSALMLGLAERPIQFALDAAERPSVESFTVTITRDLGYGLIAAAGIGGALVFIASLGRAGSDRRRSLNPWIAALGALAALVAAAGPLLPEGTASIADNWTPSAGAPAAFLVGRLVQVGVLAFSGVIGFLVVRRYGLGLVVGAMTVNVWLVVSVLAGLGDDPIGPALDNPGSVTAEADLHAVTLAGSTALLVLAVIAVIAAYDLAAREP